uniref:Uncharacterized protein n=1 Tax=Oryza meridionalis TaxID=40149 RepID=A0A0E0C610_9ORYZ
MQDVPSPLPALSTAYQPLPSLYLGFLAIWAASGFSWAFSSWRSRHFQVNNLQWILALVPLIKALQMALSYSCVHLQTCSLWMSFGVYVTGILFQTASFVSFMLISHGYCIMCERLSIRERRTTAGLGCLLYLSLIGYKAAVPYFTVFLLINYFMSFYIIFRRTSQNLMVLREQLNFIEEEDIHSLHGALNTKYTMFKRFQGTMQVAVVAFIMVYMRADDTPDNYWFRVLVREWVQFCIFMIPEASLHLPVVPLMKSTWEIAMPPIYSVEMDAADFKGLVSDHWHVGVRLSIRERRTTAGLGCLLYLSLIGYKAAVPYFTVFLLINYFMSFYIIFRRTSQNLMVLREQLNFIEEEDIHSLHGALNTKYTMFKRFQGTMQVAVVAFIMVYMRADDTPDNYWFRVLVREWVQFCIFMIPEASLHLPVVPLMKSTWEIAMPPIYSVEMDAADFKGLVSDHWHVGVRTSHTNSSCPSQPLLVLVQNPSPKVSTAATASRLQLNKNNQV